MLNGVLALVVDLLAGVFFAGVFDLAMFCSIQRSVMALFMVMAGD